LELSSEFDPDPFKRLFDASNALENRISKIVDGNNICFGRRAHLQDALAFGPCGPSLSAAI
jgi:hypothetical protein